MQLMVLGNSFGGLYVSTYDVGGNPKQIGVSKPSDNPSPGTITLDVLHFLPEQKNSTIGTSYDTVLGVFRGDWHAAADMYRAWAMKQWWAAQGPLSQRNDLPDWFKRGFVVLSLGSYDTYDSFGSQSGVVNGKAYTGNYQYANFSQLPIQLSQYLAKDNSPVLVNWHGWEKFGDWVAPDVFPPMEGWSSFNKTVAEIHAMGQHVMVGLSVGPIYTNYPGYNSTQLSWAAKEKNGANQLKSTDIARASPACPQFQDWVISTITTLAKSGVDGVELDSTFFNNYDYGNSATHPPGYGRWWASTWISILERVRASVDRINPKFILASEGLPEIFMPWIQAYISDSGDPGDNWFSANFGGNVRMVGLFSYVYSGYAIPWSRENFGGSFIKSFQYVSPQAYETYRDFAQALGVTNGAIPDYAGNPFIWDPPDSNLSRGLVWASSSFFRDFSPLGEQIPSPVISVPTIRVTTSYDSGLRDNQLSSYLTPTVLSVAALSHDGRLGYFFANVDQVSHSFSFKVDTSYLHGAGSLETVNLNESAVSVSPFDPSRPMMTRPRARECEYPYVEQPVSLLNEDHLQHVISAHSHSVGVSVTHRRARNLKGV